MIGIEHSVTSKVLFLTLGDHLKVVLLLRTYKAIHLFHVLFFTCAVFYYKKVQKLNILSKVSISSQVGLDYITSK